ncbi:DUF222 domain-containing protein [Herbiconiux sp. 11R-BC]|uniref:HNH endonuclease signature motif containing protein n=1 Tax=Herbiconiux sp. 11R-BC TaxID=3111637 RepID=UPI003C068203
MPLPSRLDEVFAELGVILGVDLAGLSDTDVLGDLAAVERVGRLVDAARVRFAGEVGARSRAELGDEGLSRSQNFTSPAKLVSAVTGASVSECQARLKFGARLRGALLLGGVVGREPFPCVSEALGRGVLAVEAAEAIVRHCLTLAERGLGPDVVADAERTLVDETIAGRLTADQTGKLALHLRELLDSDGAEPRAERQQQLRFLTFAWSADGMLRGRFALTPDQAAVWVGSMQVLQSPRATGPRFAADPAGAAESRDGGATSAEPDEHAVAENRVAAADSVAAEGRAAASDAAASVGGTTARTAEDEAVATAALGDARTAGQKNVDTLTELLTRAAAAPEMPRLGGSATTVNVHVTLADLEEGRGMGWIDGITEPVPASTIAQLRCHSATAATVFGDHGEVLHHGKTRRLFSPAQNRALAARDGGCVWGDCDRPPSWCETHHVTEWVSENHPPGRTDIGNGVLLCHFHHSHLHRSSWALIMRGGVPHLVPPAWVDVGQTPIPTTRRRTTLGSHAVGTALRGRAGSGRTRA